VCVDIDEYQKIEILKKTKKQRQGDREAGRQAEVLKVCSQDIAVSA
jgi:hypothetical protein